MALGHWGPGSDLALAPGRRTRTRPDMGWLLERVLAWEQDRKVRPFLNLLANPSVVVRTGRAWLGERLRFQKEDPQPEVSVRATRLLREVLARGGSRPAAENFLAFRGRAPSIDALLRHTGMAEDPGHDAVLTSG